MDEWLELETRAEPEAVESVSSVFAEFGQGVAIEEPVVSSLDGDTYGTDPTRTVLVRTYLPLDGEAEERRARLAEATWHLGLLRSVTPLTNVESWRYAHFGMAENSGNAAAAADPDGDGLPNLIEYATASDPTARNAAPSAR